MFDQLYKAVLPLITTATVVLVGISFINTMPDDPPDDLRSFPRWAYRWLHDFLKTVTSKTGPR